MMETMLAAAGLDLVAEMQVGWYNAAVPDDWRLPDFGRPSSRALVIRATRALWPALLARVDAAAPNPLEEHVRAAVAPAVASLGVAHELRFAPDRPPRGVAIARAAEAAGLAWLSAARLAV